MNDIIHAHDTFVKTVLSDLQIAKKFFNIHLPEEIIKKIKLDSLTLQPTSFN